MLDNETVFKALIIRAQNGDESAYLELLNGLMLFLKNYLRRRIFDRSEIEEVSQEILMAVHKALHTYDESRPFMGWFNAIVEYKIIDYIRDVKRRQGNVDLEAIKHFLAETNSDADLRMDIDKGIERLASREKSILMLLKVEGQSVTEVAQQLSLSEANVKVIAHRAYLNLRKYLGIR